MLLTFLKPSPRRKGFFFSIDAFFALTLAMLLAFSVAAFTQSHQQKLVDLHQLGRDYLVLNYTQGVPITSQQFTSLTRLNSTGGIGTMQVGAKIVSYPSLRESCPPNSGPACFQSQNWAPGVPLVFNATVSS